MAATLKPILATYEISFTSSSFFLQTECIMSLSLKSSQQLKFCVWSPASHRKENESPSIVLLCFVNIGRLFASFLNLSHSWWIEYAHILSALAMPPTKFFHSRLLGIMWSSVELSHPEHLLLGSSRYIINSTYLLCWEFSFNKPPLL